MSDQPAEHAAPPESVTGRRLAQLQARKAEQEARAAGKASGHALTEEQLEALQARAKRWRRQPKLRERFISKTADFAMLKLEREMRRASGKEFRDSLKQFMAVAALAAGSQPPGKKDDDE